MCVAVKVNLFTKMDLDWTCTGLVGKKVMVKKYLIREYLVRNITLQNIWLKIFDVGFQKSNPLIYISGLRRSGVMASAGWRCPPRGSRCCAWRTGLRTPRTGGRRSSSSPNWTKSWTWSTSDYSPLHRSSKLAKVQSSSSRQFPTVWTQHESFP